MQIREFGDVDEFMDAVLESVNAKDADLSGRRFENCEFKNCSLSGASARGASFLECTFIGCDLSNTKLVDARFRDVAIIDSKLVGLNWASVGILSNPRFERCLLNYSSFENLDLRKAIIEDCLAREVDFTGANLSEATLCGTDLGGAIFSNNDLRRADFRRAKNYSIRISENKMKSAKFSMPEATLLLYAMEIQIEE